MPPRGQGAGKFLLGIIELKELIFTSHAAGGLGMEPAKEEELWNLPEFPVHGQFGQERNISSDEASHERGSAQRFCPDQSVMDVAQSEVLTELDETLTRPLGIQLQTILVMCDQLATLID